MWAPGDDIQKSGRLTRLLQLQDDRKLVIASTSGACGHQTVARGYDNTWHDSVHCHGKAAVSIIIPRHPQFRLPHAQSMVILLLFLS